MMVTSNGTTFDSQAALAATEKLNEEFKKENVKKMKVLHEER